MAAIGEVDEANCAIGVAIAALRPGELDFALAQTLRERVWGQGLPPPTFDDTFTVLSTRVVGGQHTRLTVERGTPSFSAAAEKLPAA